MINEIIFDLKNVNYSYLGKYPALCGVDFQVRRGECVAILGANGSGKSTLLAMLDGLIFPDNGGFSAFGRQISSDIFRQDDFRRFFRSKVGFLFQNSEVQLFCPTVREEILFGPAQLDIPCDEANRKLKEVCDMLEISHLIDRPPHHLSIGEKKRVAIASVLIMDPDVLLLDEPTAGLDPKTCFNLIDIVRAQHAAGKTVITATHDIHIVSEIADIIYIFSNDKKIVAGGKASDILNDKELLLKYNLTHAHIHRHGDEWHIHPHRHPEKDHPQA